jgi:hypothetical protein
MTTQENYSNTGCQYPGTGVASVLSQAVHPGSVLGGTPGSVRFEPSLSNPRVTQALLRQYTHQLPQALYSNILLE